MDGVRFLLKQDIARRSIGARASVTRGQASAECAVSNMG